MEQLRGYRCFKPVQFWDAEKNPRIVLEGSTGVIWHNTKFRAACGSGQKRATTPYVEPPCTCGAETEKMFDWQVMIHKRGCPQRRFMYGIGGGRRIKITRSKNFKDARQHLLGGINCGCGIWLSKSVNSYEFEHYLHLGCVSRLPYTVLASCLPYGAVVEAEHGYRAERVEIDALWLFGCKKHKRWLRPNKPVSPPDEIIAQLESRYNVQVMWKEDTDDLTKLFCP